jgi:predicted RNA-binding protein with PUA-like domain
MNYFLAKTEPSTYSIEDLQADGVTTWNGVKNPQAIKFIQEMQIGDRVFIYHSGDNPGIAGLAEVISEPEPDPKIKKSWTVDLKFLTSFDHLVGLKEIKTTGKFDDFKLVRQGRLSTMSVPPEFVEWLQKEKKLKF